MSGAGEQLRLSVVLLVRNGERELPLQLTALAAQEVPFPWELIAVDDGSTDRTGELLEKAGVDGLPVRVVAGPGRGVGAAREAGSAVAGGDDLIFLDHDDEIEPGFLQAMVTALEQHELVAARLDCRALNPGWVGEYRPAQQREEPSNDFLPFAKGGSIGIRRATFEGLGGVDPSLHGPEDRDLCYRAALAGVELRHGSRCRVALPVPERVARDLLPVRAAGAGERSSSTVGTGIAACDRG